MEELRSTEVLEREILEDARKKAAKVLKTADDAIAQQKRDWEKKLGDDLDSIRKSYMNRMKKTVEDIFARQPLDKRRLRLKTNEEFLSAAIKDFLSSLDRERLISVLERELLRLLETVGFEAEGSAVSDAAAVPAVVRYSGLSLAEAQSVLSKSPAAFDWQYRETIAPNGSPNDLSENDLSFNETSTESAYNHFPSIVIDTGKFKLSASVEAAAAALLNDKREELAAALLGSEALHD